MYSNKNSIDDESATKRQHYLFKTWFFDVFSLFIENRESCTHLANRRLIAEIIVGTYVHCSIIQH